MEMPIHNGRSPGHKVGIQFEGLLPGESQHIASFIFEESRKYYSKYI
jgi:hypothetical protein